MAPRGDYSGGMTTTGDTYNGWTNYETWATALWIDNEQGSYTASREMAREQLDAAREDPEDLWDDERRQARYYLAAALSEEFEEAAPDLGASVWADLLGRALGRVDWTEIAENLIDEMAEV